jgi:hypothetical protein
VKHALVLLLAALIAVGCGEGRKYERKQSVPRKLPGTERPVEVKKHPLYAILDTAPRNEYERQAPRILYKAMNAEALAQFCGRWFPDYGRDIADAYTEWRDRNQATMKELVDRSVAVWNIYAGEDVAYVKMVQPHLRKQLVDSITREFDNSPIEKFKTICSELPRDLRSSKWDLESRFRQELAFLRQHPLTPGS